MTTGVLPLNVLKALMYSNTGFFETSQTDIDEAWKITVGNYDGAGISQGPSQMNFDFGDPLSLIFRNVYNNHRATWDSVFAPYPTEKQQLYDAVFVKTQLEKIAWADSISYVDASQEKRGLNAPWLPIFQAFAMEQDYRDEYVEVVNVQYYPRVEKLFRSMACKSRMSFASFYDLSVNRGRYYPVLSLLADFDAIDANTNIDETEKERQKIYQINDRANKFENGIGDPTVYDDRRYCMANQGGNYFGATYDPEVQFDINQEPALVEKADFIKGIKNMALGATKIKKVNFGEQPIFEEPFYTSEAPDTQFRILYNDWQGMANQTVVTLTAGQPLWIDVQNWLGTRLYYTTDGSTPTTSSQRYTEALTFDTSVTLKTLAVSVYGVTEAIKTLAVTVTGGAGVTSVSPTSTTQNTIPFNVTLTNSLGNTIYYKVGAGTQQTYSAPFPVSQVTNNVGVNILVTYWSTGETEKTITYNTAGALTGAPVVTATPGNYYVRLDWAPTANTTSYSVYRSTVSGQLGTLISDPYQAGVGFDDGTAENNVTYYYTVKSANYGDVTDGVQVSATPQAVSAPTYRYVRYTGYGDQTGTVSRLVEIQALEGATNRLLNKPPMAGYTPVNGGTIGVATDGAKVQSAGYPLWWGTEPTGIVTWDMGALYPIDTINVTGYSPTIDPRQTQFIIDVSKDNLAWTNVINYTTNTTPQPIDGFNFAVT